MSKYIVLRNDLLTGTVTPDEINRTFNITLFEVTRATTVDQESILEAIEFDVVEGGLGTSEVKGQVGNVSGLLVSVGDNNVVKLNIASSNSQNSRVGIGSCRRLSVVTSAVFDVDSAAAGLQNNIRARNRDFFFVCSRSN